MSEKVLHALRDRFGDAVLATHSYRGDDTAVIRKDKALEVASFLRDDPAMRFDMPTDLTVVDWLGEAREPRFEVVLHLYSVTHKHRVRVKFPVSEEECSIASFFPVYPGLRYFEREAWDMYGVKFEGAPDLRRMFMYEEFVGHPLRKDYPKEKRQPLARREGYKAS